MHSNWRDCDAWRKENLSMNTASNEACKLYDISLSQIIGWYDNPEYDGVLSSFSKMLNADTSFVMGHCLKLGFELLGNNNALTCNMNVTRQSVQNLIDLKNKQAQSLSQREIYHVKAIEMLAKGELKQASNYWEEILLDSPNDMLAIKLAHSIYFYLGYKTQMRDSLARVIPLWKSNTPLYSYLYGMQAFGQTQTNLYDQAEMNARKGLSLNRLDAWATHAICHVNEYTNKHDVGIKFLLDTESDWSRCNLISNHNYWHMGLFYLERNEHEKVIDLLDNHLMPQSDGSTLDLVNSSSLLIRLKIDGFERNDLLMSRWLKLKESYGPRIEEHGYIYSDSHIAMLLSACGTDDEKKTYLKSLNDFIDSSDIELIDNDINSKIQKSNNRNIKSYLKYLNEELASALFNSIFCFNQNEYEAVVDLLYPIRYDLIKIGGSYAQLDIFNQILVYSALNSKIVRYKKIGLALINERLSLKPDSNLSKRLVAKFCSEEELNSINL